MSLLTTAQQQWLAQQLPTEAFTVKPLLGDASFRQYYRVILPNRSFILMDAPPKKEKTQEFIDIARALAPLGLGVPKIYAYEPEQGLALLSDLGDILLLDVLDVETVDAQYTQAMEALFILQQAHHQVPVFDEAHARLELNYFPDWCLNQLLSIDLSAAQSEMLNNVNEYLVQNILAQPQVFIHRDYHSRNIMVLPQGELGIIDFQDAMKGPITYDLVSLLKDCYITWPEDKVQQWVYQFWEMLQKRNNTISHLMTPAEKVLNAHFPFDIFYQWFELTGLQRHIKVFGVFSRLKIRDHKPHYLKDMPRILQYVLNVTQKYSVLADFHEFCSEIVANALQDYFERHEIVTDEIKVA